jgi:hypothetical protein
MYCVTSYEMLHQVRIFWKISRQLLFLRKYRMALKLCFEILQYGLQTLDTYYSVPQVCTVVLSNETGQIPALT